MQMIHCLFLVFLTVCVVESYSPVSCKRVQCEPTTCPNPIKGRCCNTCLEDCRAIFCAQAQCPNPVTPLGRCCPMCPSHPFPIDCSRIQCVPPSCPNPIPPGIGECCPSCLENCAVVSCVLPQCPNSVFPPGRCCPVCPSPPLPPDCSAVLCLAPTCPNPIPPPPGQCCARCQEDCSFFGCARPNCDNPVTPPGRCCPVCPNPDDVCALQSDAGPCETAITRWFFDSSAQQCRTFTFGGCQGNGNNFKDLSTCLNTCKLRCPPGVPQALCTALPCSITRCSAFPDAICLSDFCGGCNARFFQSDGTEVTNKCSVPTNTCSLPSVPGPCRGAFPQWFYNSQTKQCHEFIYGGCGGNENRFHDLHSCLSVCASKCPPGVPIVRCFADPCSVSQCSSFSNTICISNFCGGCNARFFLNDGTEVTDRCDKATCRSGQTITPCGKTCNPTCESQQPLSCRGFACLPGCSCPKDTVYDRRVSKCVDSDDCGNCPPGKPPVNCLINPCTQTTCSNIPNAECLFDNCGGCFARFFVGNKEVTGQCKVTSTVCPIKGQIFQQCRGCSVTCANPNIICTLQCRPPGCGCPAGQVIDEINNKCVTRDKCPNSSCPIKGQVFQRCRTCPAACNNRDLICTQECRPGCGCPQGQLIDKENNRCVPANQCPNQCKIDGQVYQRCRTCPATCKSFNLPCSRICRPGCGCPPGQIIDENLNKCVPLNKCSNQRCPIQGQTFHRCKPCLVTCKDVGKPIACPLVCAPGCGCPSGTVLDEMHNRCIREQQCPQRVDCSKIICPQIRCLNTIPAYPENGKCCPTCKPGPQCPIRGQIYHRCKPCSATCSDPNKKCIAVCQPGCGCPSKQVIDQKRQQCVTQTQCTTSQSDRCLLPVSRGSCRGRSLRYYYNSKTGRCHGFIYGRCGGNQNNFSSRYSCERTCRKT